MKADDIYDPEVARHQEVFTRFGPTLALVISGYQEIIQVEVDRKNPGKFRPTSGFRAASHNSLVGGVPDSLHIWGMARDFVPVDGDFAHPPIVCERKFRLLRSARCWHVELR